MYNRCLHNLKTLHPYVDPIVIASELSKTGDVSVAELHFLLRLSDREEIWQRLLTISKSKCNVQTLIAAIEHCGYNVSTYCSFRQGLQRAQCQNPSRKFAQKLLVNLKTQTHNAVFANPREFLHKLSCVYYRKLVSETRAHRKQTIADRYASVVCAEIDSHIMLYKESELTMKKLRKLKALIPHTTNACVTGVAYNARMAIASTVAGDFATAHNFLQLSKVDSFNLQACVEVENMLYIQVFILLTQYELKPSAQLREEILQVSSDGLQLLQEEEELSRVFWKRMFLLRMTYCLFGLSMTFHRIPECIINLESIKQGKKYLAEIDRYWDGIESRRKIWYYVARARQYELECDATSITTAIWYIDQAIDIAENGNFSEKDYATLYRSGLITQRQCFTEECSIPSLTAQENEEDHPSESHLNNSVLGDNQKGASHGISLESREIFSNTQHASESTSTHTEDVTVCCVSTTQYDLNTCDLEEDNSRNNNGLNVVNKPSSYNQGNLVPDSGIQSHSPSSLKSDANTIITISDIQSIHAVENEESMITFEGKFSGKSHIKYEDECQSNEFSDMNSNNTNFQDKQFPREYPNSTEHSWSGSSDSGIAVSVTDDLMTKLVSDLKIDDVINGNMMPTENSYSFTSRSGSDFDSLRRISDEDIL